MSCFRQTRITPRTRTARRIVLTIALGLSGAAYADEALYTPPPSTTGFRASVQALYDDNVTRTDTPREILSDQSLAAGFGDGLLIPFSPFSRVLLEAGFGVEQFDRWRGLSHADLGIRAALQYRPSATYFAPTLEFGVRATASAYEQSLRSGIRSVSSLSITQPITDQLTGFAAAEHDERNAQNATFAGHGDSVRLHLDDTLSSALTLYTGIARRYGDIVTTQLTADCPGNPNLSCPNLASTADPAFGATARTSLRLKASSLIGNLGLNYTFAAGQSVDVFWQKARVLPVIVAAPGVTQPKYVDQQFGVSYLVQF